MKLHLGCGQKYLEGYVNIDYPPSEHTVQTTQVADLFADITTLSYPANSVEEVRLHHVFEHFPRAQACGLLVSWHSWLKPGGTLTIEVPDFDAMAWVVLNPLSDERAKHVALRHIFGSQEAQWAVHFEGWSAKRLAKLLIKLGFGKVSVRKKAWLGTKNIIITAKKTQLKVTKKVFRSIVDDYLDIFLVEKVSSELRLKHTWMEIYEHQVSLSYAKSKR